MLFRVARWEKYPEGGRGGGGGGGRCGCVCRVEVGVSVEERCGEYGVDDGEERWVRGRCH